MSWSTSGRVNAGSVQGDVEGLTVAHELGQGGQGQLQAAKEAALSLINSGVIEGQEFNVSLSGHCQADSPGSGADSIYVSIGAIKE